MNPHGRPHEPESCASAYSATSACLAYLLYINSNAFATVFGMCFLCNIDIFHNFVVCYLQLNLVRNSMSETTSNKVGFSTKLRNFQQKYLPYNGQTVAKLAKFAVILWSYLLVWALVFKLCSQSEILTNYGNLKNMTVVERIMWDLIPFNYRGNDYLVHLQKRNTVLNCFVLVPFGVLFCYTFKKQNLLRNALICLAFSLGIEMLQLSTTFANPATEDLITNTLGCFIGYGLNALLFKRMSHKTKVVVLTAANALLITLTIYSVITFIVEWDTIYGALTRTL